MGMAAAYLATRYARRITGSTVFLKDASNNPVPATVSYSSSTATLVPTSALAFNTTYTYAKSMDENSQSGNGVQDSTNPAGSYGLSDFDVRHHFVFSGTWTLPFHGNRLKEGWLIADVTQIQTGNPLNVVTGSGYSGSTTAPLGQIRPTLLASPSVGVHKALGNFNIPYIVGTSCLAVAPGSRRGAKNSAARRINASMPAS